MEIISTSFLENKLELRKDQKWAGLRSPESTRLQLVGLASSPKLATNSSSFLAKHVPEMSLSLLFNEMRALDFICISELLLHNKQPQKLKLDTTNVYYFSQFYGIGIWVGLSLVALLALPGLTQMALRTAGPSSMWSPILQQASPVWFPWQLGRGPRTRMGATKLLKAQSQKSHFSGPRTQPSPDSKGGELASTS